MGLVAKSKHYGICGPLLNWLISYLTRHAAGPDHQRAILVAIGLILLENNNDSVLMGLNLKSHTTAQLKSFFLIYKTIQHSSLMMF